MALILAYILMILLGGFALWTIIRLFSGNPVNILQCFLWAGITEWIGLLGIPFVPFIILFILLIKIGDFEGVHALFATILYALIKLFLFGIIVAILHWFFG